MENVLVVGASSSVGNEISSIFVSNDMRVIATYSSNPSEIETITKDVLKLDVTSDSSIEIFKQNLIMRVKTLDVVILLPAILLGQKLANYNFTEIDRTMSTNITGHIKLINKIFEFLHSDSRILVLSSISGQRGSFDPVYSASKGALLALVKSLVHELPTGARINAVAPGLIQDSNMFKNMPVERRRHHQDQIPSGALLRSTDLARIVFDICQSHWRHLNGACIDLNGGQYVR
jgi:3-oxoacyl-[acyl-carrier protein] reductase